MIKTEGSSENTNNEKGRIDATFPASANSFFSFTSFNFQAIMLAFLGLLFYANTFTHESAFDDRMAITGNEYVQRGISGIPDILTHDAYQSYLEQRGGGNQLSGGRYRPLSLITFAIEQQVLGVNDETVVSSDAREELAAQQMHTRHVMNVLLYILSVIALFYLFKQVIFPSQPLPAFIGAMLFLIHPVHTEVVANVKSRDEILSVLFIALTFINVFQYQVANRTKNLVLACLFFFLALLSKEYAVTLIVLLPLSIYIVLGRSVNASVRSVLPFLVPLGLYLLMRFAATSGPAEGAEQNVMNNPYLYATVSQKVATELLVLLYYIKLLFFPYPLVADYSYSQIAYTDFSNPLVWCSLVLHLAIIVAAIWLIRRRHILGFAFAIYMLNLLLISNLFFSIGAPMGERLIYHSSIGFAITIAYMLNAVAARMKPSPISRGALATLLVAVAVLSGFKTISRNKDWKNDSTLFLKDVHTVPNSALVNNNAAAACMAVAKKEKANKVTRDKWFQQAIAYLDKVIAIDPNHINARSNRGLCYFNMGYPDKALPDWVLVRKAEPADPRVNQYLSILAKYYFNQGLHYGMLAGKQDSAIVAFQKGTMINPGDAFMWHNLSIASYLHGSLNEAKMAAGKALALAPNSESSRRLNERVNSISVKSASFNIPWAIR
jgi:tetratricopeptide (TPR) repeat protein